MPLRVPGRARQPLHRLRRRRRDHAARLATDARPPLKAALAKVEIRAVGALVAAAGDAVLGADAVAAVVGLARVAQRRVRELLFGRRRVEPRQLLDLRGRGRDGGGQMGQMGKCNRWANGTDREEGQRGRGADGADGAKGQRVRKWRIR